MPKRTTFSPELREKLLLWCDRHCCLCRKQCDVLIELHHIDPKGRGGSDDEDNAIPLCFDCHAKVGHYNATHPKGSKFSPNELKRRRDQIYDEFTQHLVPPLHYLISQALDKEGKNRRELPDVGFQITHMGGTPPVNVGVIVEPFIDFERCADFRDSIYQGEELWNLNPQKTVHGHFSIPARASLVTTPIIIGVSIVVRDYFGRTHTVLPVSYVYDRKSPDWWLDPFDPVLSARRLKAELSEAA